LLDVGLLGGGGEPDMATAGVIDDANGQALAYEKKLGESRSA
jgi:hypothetical protein